VSPKTERVRYEELAADLLNHYKKDGSIYVPAEPHLRKFFAGWRAVDITADKLREFVRKRQEEGASNGTINRSLAALRQMFILAVEARKIRRADVPVIKLLEERNVRIGFVDDEQYEKLARFYLELWWRAYLAVAYNFGWRKGNMLNLRVRQVDLLNQTICLYPGTTKNDEGQTVKMTTEVYELLCECVRGKEPDDYVFTRHDGRPVRDFTKKWRNACIALGLGRLVCESCGLQVTKPARNRRCSNCKENGLDGQLKYRGLLIHDLRRSAVRNLERSGVPRSVAMKITGHKTEAVYRRYAIVSESDLAEAARKLDAKKRHSSSTVAIGHEHGAALTH
jgi:integrase